MGTSIPESLAPPRTWGNPKHALESVLSGDFVQNPLENTKLLGPKIAQFVQLSYRFFDTIFAVFGIF